MQDINLYPQFVAIGIAVAALSIAFINLIESSRILVALAKDELFGIILMPVAKCCYRGIPIAGLVLSWFFVQLILFSGTFNSIAQIISILSLLSYFAINLACLTLEYASAPNFRPSFQYFTWHTAALGLIGCITMMFFINMMLSAYGILLCLILVAVLYQRSLPVYWGFISQSLIFRQVCKYLLLLESCEDRTKFWRPQFLLLVGNARSSVPLITFTNDLIKSGLYIGHIKIGKIGGYDTDPVSNEYPLWLSFKKKLKIKAFVEVTLANTVRDGLHHLVRLSGLGAMKPNTILFGFHNDDTYPIEFFESNSLFEELHQVSLRDQIFFQLQQTEEFSSPSIEEYVLMIRDTIHCLQKNVCIARHFYKLNKNKIVKSHKALYIDIWPMDFFDHMSYKSIDSRHLFMLQLACILNMVPGWKTKTILRIFLCIDPAEDDPEMEKHQWETMLQILKISAEIKVVLWEHIIPSRTESSLPEISLPPDNYLYGANDMIKIYSDNTSVIFIYLPIPPKDINEHVRYLECLNTLTNNLKPTLLVHGISPEASIIL